MMLFKIKRVLDTLLRSSNSEIRASDSVLRGVLGRKELCYNFVELSRYKCK